MNPAALFRGPDAPWNAVIAGTAAVTLYANIVGLLAGITSVLPHLLYIPVVTAAYRYPRKGGIFAAVIAGIYLLSVIMTGASAAAAGEAVVRAAVLIAIGWLIAILTSRLREREDLYEGLFDHSEAGSMLLAPGETGYRVEQANWKAASLLGAPGGDLENVPVASFWTGGDRGTVAARVAADGAIYTTETVFTRMDGQPVSVLLSVARLREKRAILTFVDITRRVIAEQASRTANEKLALLSRITGDHLHRGIDGIIDAAVELEASAPDAGTKEHAARIQALAWNLARQLLMTESYRELGTAPAGWLRVQDVAGSVRMPPGSPAALRAWTGRLEVFADPLFRDVITHLVENSIRHGGPGLTRILITYRETGGGLDLVIEDDGKGIPAAKKEQMFAYDSGGHAGIGLFICTQILAVTGISIAETGGDGTGARFVLHVPARGYRIEGRDADSPPYNLPPGIRAGTGGAQHRSGVTVRELLSEEFPIAEALWVNYHQTKGNPQTDRIFAAFSGDVVVSLARCRWHPDGFEVDAVYTPEDQRGHGYANAVMWGLIEACGHETLYMHSVWNLTGFYGHYGFVPIPEVELPLTIRERYAWAEGEMEGANVRPMMRPASP